MNVTKIRRTIALVLLVLLLLATIWVGLFAQQIGSRDLHEWIHVFCLTQAVLLAACAVYGPGRFIVRLPLVFAWGLAIGFALTVHNLITLQGKGSLAAGAILVVAGTLPLLAIFALHRWRTGGVLAFGNQFSGRTAARSAQQLSLRMLMILTSAFGITGVAARTAITAPTDPFGTEHDILVLHAFLGFFPCLAAAPALLVVARPSWKIALACSFFVFVAMVEPLLLAMVVQYIFHKARLLPSMTTWAHFQEAWIEAMIFNGQAVAATVIYVLLARATGFRLVVPDQSNDKNPNPSGEPETEAGCVQD